MGFDLYGERPTIKEGTVKPKDINWDTATDEEKAALRDKLRASRKEWEVAMKAHRVEVGKRMKEIREEFKNNRDKVIEGNKPGE